MTICPACTLPIPDDERVIVQFEGAPDEVWHRDCFERERREFHGGAGGEDAHPSDATGQPRLDERR